MRAALLVCMMVLAGCSDEPVAEPVDVSPTGVLHGVVVDPAVVPIAGATVRLSDGLQTVTDADGGFRITDLEGGVVSLTISKAGYSNLSATATIKPGVAEPQSLRLQMTPDLGTAVYVESETFSGFASRAATVAGARYGASDAPDQFFEQIPAWFQVEMVWRSTQALGEQMELTFISYEEGAATGSDFSRAIGPSPLANGISRQQMADENLGGPNFISLAIFAAANDPLPAGALLDQPYDLFMHRFHGFTPPEGWQFSIDGLPEP